MFKKGDLVRFIRNKGGEIKGTPGAWIYGEIYTVKSTNGDWVYVEKDSNGSTSNGFHAEYFDPVVTIPNAVIDAGNMINHTHYSVKQIKDELRNTITRLEGILKALD